MNAPWAAAAHIKIWAAGSHCCQLSWIIWKTPDFGLLSPSLQVRKWNLLDNHWSMPFLLRWQSESTSIFAQMTSCDVTYDVIYHYLSILNIWRHGGIDSPGVNKSSSTRMPSIHFIKAPIEKCTTSFPGSSPTRPPPSPQEPSRRGPWERGWEIFLFVPYKATANLNHPLKWWSER